MIVFMSLLLIHVIQGFMAALHESTGATEGSYAGSRPQVAAAL